MTATGPFDAHGFTFEISSPIADLIEAADDVLVDMRLADDHRTSTVHRIDIEPSVGAHGTRTPYRVRVDGESVHELLAEGSVLSHVLMEVNQRATERVWANGSIALHASVVAGPGGAVVVAGASHSGKTTLATALALAGDGRFAFVADEVCALDPTDLTVAAYGKPAALRTPGRDLLAPHVERLRRPGSRFERDERFVPPRDLGRLPSGPRPVSAVVFPRFLWSTDTIDGTARPQPTGPSTLDPSSPTDALARLMRLTLGTQPLAAHAFRSLERLVRNVGAHDLGYDDALEAADRLVHLCQHSGGADDGR